MVAPTVKVSRETDGSVRVGTTERLLCFAPSGSFKRSTIMQRYAVIAATAMSVAFGAQALAQAVSVEIAPEQRTKIKEYVVKEKVPRVTGKERYRVGSTVPADVELREVPADWGPSVRNYRYYYADTGVHFVDPASRRVVYDID